MVFQYCLLPTCFFGLCTSHLPCSLRQFRGRWSEAKGQRHVVRAPCQEPHQAIHQPIWGSHPPCTEEDWRAEDGGGPHSTQQPHSLSLTSFAMHDDPLHKLLGARFFSCLGAASGGHKILSTDTDKPRTAVRRLVTASPRFRLWA